jgi:hypothetical protein
MEECLMYSDIRNGSRAARAGAFMALWVMLAMELGVLAAVLGARPAAAAPFAYVANGSNLVLQL